MRAFCERGWARITLPCLKVGPVSDYQPMAPTENPLMGWLLANSAYTAIGTCCETKTRLTGQSPAL